MASHLSISVELIAFMKWVLHNKKGALNAFLRQALDAEIRAEILSIMHESRDLSGDELYQIVNSFLGHIEEQIMDEIEKDVRGDSHHHEQKSADDLYDVLSPQMQAQLTQVFDDHVIHQGMHHAAAQLMGENSPNEVEHSEKVKKHVLMSNLLNQWTPPTDDEVN